MLPPLLTHVRCEAAVLNLVEACSGLSRRSHVVAKASGCSILETGGRLAHDLSAAGIGVCMVIECLG